MHPLLCGEHSPLLPAGQPLDLGIHPVSGHAPACGLATCSQSCRHVPRQLLTRLPPAAMLQAAVHLVRLVLRRDGRVLVRRAGRRDGPALCRRAARPPAGLTPGDMYKSSLPDKCHLRAVIALELKHRAPKAHTMLEVIGRDHVVPCVNGV